MPSVRGGVSVAPSGMPAASPSAWVPAALARDDARQVWHDALRPLRWTGMPWFPALRMAAQPNNAFMYRSVATAVLHAERTQLAIRDVARKQLSESRETGASLDKCVSGARAAATKIVNFMAGCVWRPLLRVSGWFLYHTFSRTHKSITVNDAQLARLPRDKPLVFLPTHKTHVDYILISLLCFYYDVKLPHIAAGENLNIPFFGQLARYHGAFFIRRRSDPSDALYRTILREYIMQALLDNSNVEVFLEGGRARNGRPMPPKMGLFSAVLEAIWEGIIDDALLVPVGISYDAIPETSYPAELLGTPKTTESFWMAIRGFFTAFRRDYGHVYVDFGAPVSARAFLAMHQEHKDAVLTSMSLRDIVSVGASMGAPAVALTANLASSAQAVRDLGSLMLRHARDIAVVTDVGVVALLLTTLHRGGASRAVLRRDFAWLRDIIEDRGYTTSARMRRSADEAFDRAVATLGGHLLLDSADVDFVQMPLLLEQRLHVSFYANQSSHPLVPEALLLTTAMTFEGDAFDERALKERVTMLCSILEAEYLLYMDPHTMRLLNAAMQRLEQLTIFAAAPDDSALLRVNELAVQSPFARMLLLILRPAIDAYCLVIEQLHALKEGPLDEKALLAVVQQHALAEYRANKIAFAESCALDMLQRSITMLVRWNVLQLVNKEGDDAMGAPVVAAAPSQRGRLSKSHSFLRFNSSNVRLSADSGAAHADSAPQLEDLLQFRVRVPEQIDYQQIKSHM